MEGSRTRSSGAERWRSTWLAAVVTIAGLGGPSVFLRPAHAVDAAAIIRLTDRLTFAPARATVGVGSTVEWKNVSVLVHTVTDDPDLVAKDADYALPEGAKPFNSGNIEPKGTFEHTFAVPGTYRYFCIPHEPAGMVGEVVVTKSDP